MPYFIPELLQSSCNSKNIFKYVDSFLDKNGTILVDNEVIFYETTTPAPNIALTPGINYDQVKLKWSELASP